MVFAGCNYLFTFALSSVVGTWVSNYNPHFTTIDMDIRRKFELPKSYLRHTLIRWVNVNVTLMRRYWHIWSTNFTGPKIESLVSKWKSSNKFAKWFTYQKPSESSKYNNCVTKSWYTFNIVEGSRLFFIIYILVWQCLSYVFFHVTRNGKRA